MTEFVTPPEGAIVHKSAPLAGDGTRLLAVMGELYANEINCGIASFWDGGFEAWVGDPMNGERKASFHPDDGNVFEAAADWLTMATCRRFPNSQFALARGPAVRAAT